MATDEEIVSLHKLFRLYNIQYINNIIISVLELIYYALRLFAMFSNNSSSSSRRLTVSKAGQDSGF